MWPNGPDAGCSPRGAGVRQHFEHGRPSGSRARSREFCTLLSATDISDAMGRRFPSPTRTSNGPGEQDCDSVPPAGNDMSFKLYLGTYCVEGQPVSQQCLTSQSSGFATNKQTAGTAQDISNLGDRAFCFTPGPHEATVEVLKGWMYISVEADTCAHAQKLAGVLLAKMT